jgi:50S ribosomal protein L16 3-hydroxylase
MKTKLKGKNMQFLGGISQAEFLKEYWEKKPLLIKNAVTNIESFATSEDLKELAFDESFETRIVYNDDYKKFDVKHGPLVESDFNSRKWTYACHSLNALDENFFQLEKLVNFIPTYMFDDVMATFSNADSTIGAHIDKYNVFILQGSGSRRWELEENPNTDYIEGIPLKILKEFNPTIEWVLEPGDMIYIPSSIAHRGTSITESISYSIGFKSLENQIILEKFLVDSLENLETEEYLKNSQLTIQADTSVIDPSVIEHFYSKAKEHLINKETFKKWFISFLSTPKEEIESGEIYVEEEIIDLAKNNMIMKDVYSRFNSFLEEDDYILSINKNLYRVDSKNYLIIKSWFSESSTQSIKINFEELDNQSWPLLIDLFRNGTFFFEEE